MANFSLKITMRYGDRHLMFDDRNKFWGGIYSCSMLVVAKEVPATLFGQGRNSQSCCDWISLLDRFINGATWGSWHKCLEREIYLAPSICLSHSTLSGASKDLYLVLCKDFFWCSYCVAWNWCQLIWLWGRYDEKPQRTRLWCALLLREELWQNCYSEV